MPLLSHSAFQTLSQVSRDRAVSIYLPTHVGGAEIRQDPIRLKNLLRDAETQLQNQNVSGAEIEEQLRPALDLLEDETFWRYQSHGLAVFNTPEMTEIYRLPLEFEPLATVSNRFHLKPLLPLFFENKYFYILALSQNRVRLFQATRYQVAEVPLAEVPTSLETALQYDDPEKQVQFHSNTAGEGQPVYHGHGVGQQDDKSAIRRFLAKVNRGLESYLHNESAPLVLASVDYLQAMYREVTTYSQVLDEGISGNPDTATAEELKDAAWPKVESMIEQSHQEAAADYHDLQGTGKASDAIAQLAIAAYRGQIDTLWLTPHTHHWGSIDPDTGQVEQHEQPQPQDVDLLDFIAVQTFLKGGTVYTTEPNQMPTQSPAAAIYRYGVPAEV